MAEEELLPLAHVAEVVVVEQHNLHGRLLFHDGAQLLDGHLQSAVAEEEADRAVGRAEGGADGCRQAVAHGAHAARGDHAAALREAEVARCHHLVLAHVGHHHRLVACELGHAADDFAHLERTFCGVNLRFDDALLLECVPLAEALAPLRVFCLLQQGRDGGERLLAVAEHRQIHLHVLVDFRGVNVEVDFLSLPGVGVELARDTVVEPHAHGNQQVAFLRLLVRT